MYNHINYMQSVAASLVAAPEFFPAFSMDELVMMDAKLSSIKGKVLIAVDGKENTHELNGADAMHATPIYSVIVAGPTNSSKPSSIFAMRDECEPIIQQIIAKLQLDPDVDVVGGFKTCGIGPIGDNFYGVYLTFSLSESESYTLDPLMWKA